MVNFDRLYLQHANSYNIAFSFDLIMSLNNLADFESAQNHTRKSWSLDKEKGIDEVIKTLRKVEPTHTVI